ncbi:glycosyltransferase family 8 protein [Desulfurispira natronophila]|uniref:Lipopolysaccharide biosynthesis glycosyltransferase n=1 Tax=Desulfurispira natronophila TaxID=682562 RepID=A0A7W8DGZ8_9BACT|nr:glycosyltransferase family 8 protein [Desulfurispira natronophila]MBB5021884.1 lipopolysaccharide biosynthesis glycosyltransferase [Desulfurispira natronophila]
MTQSDLDRVHILAATDNNYAQHLSVMAVSLLENTSNPELITLHILDCGITSEEKAKMLSSLNRYSAKINFIHVPESILDGLPLRRHGLAAYARLFAADLCDPSIEKILYLDCDIIVNEDVRALYATQLNEHIIAAVKDFSFTAPKRLELPLTNYFSSGVLLINLRKWAEEDIAKKTIAFLINNAHLVKHSDQDGLNVLLHERWKRLPLRWNVQMGVYKSSWRKWHELGFTQEELHEALTQPAIIHYINNSKPWFYTSNHPLKHLYWHYLAMTAWAEYRYPDKNVKNILRKITQPRKLLKAYGCRKKLQGKK